MTTDTVTPYTTITPYAEALPSWVGPSDGERLVAYTAYQNMYWSEETAFHLIRRNEDGAPLYIPKPKVICDTTAHYLLKGMKVGVRDPEKHSALQLFIDSFCARERFYSRFEIAKGAGVIRGDWVMHITADPMKEEGSRISLTSVDPAAYFPEFDTDDLNRRTGVKLVEQTIHPDDPTKTVVKVLRYWYELDTDGRRISPLVWREENLWEMEGWNNPKKAKKIRALIPKAPLPTAVTQIPVYHFRNAEFDGFEFGNSELKGYERVFEGINQAMSDLEISLALVGLGVYATDAGRPKNSQGKEVDWIVSPGTVWEMPGATMVKRLEGITSVTPVLDHVRYLEESIYQASNTSDVALGRIDAQTAESGIALALKFVPQLAKTQYRDTAGVEILSQMWFDWKMWVAAYEGQTYEEEIVITLGDKLPLNRPKTFEELNNMLDRKVISRAFYRQECERLLGYHFPDSIEDDIIEEELALQRARMELEAEFAEETDEDGNPTIAGPGGRKVGAGDTKEKKDKNRSNNKEAVNESKGTEVK